MVQQQTADFLFAFIFIAMAMTGGMILLLTLLGLGFGGGDSVLKPFAVLGIGLIGFAILGVVVRARLVREAE